MPTRRDLGGAGPGGRAQRGARSGATRATPGRGRGAPTPRAGLSRTTAGHAPAGRTGTATQRRPSGGAARTRAPQPRRFTGRAAVLGMVLVGLLLSYAYPVRVYLAQQAEIAGLEQQQAEQRRRIAGLQDQRDKWNDDEYVKTRAARDLHYFLPGETPLVTFGNGDDANAPIPGETAPTTHAVAPAWYQKLWTSVGAADHPEIKP